MQILTDTLYVKHILQSFSLLDMSVIYIGNDVVSAINKDSSIIMFGKNAPIFPFKSICTRDRIKELSDRINKFPDTEITFDKLQNEEVRLINIKSKNGKIKSFFTCMKESVIYGREKTLEDVAAGATATPRERPPKGINANAIKPTFQINSFDSETLSDIKDSQKMMGCDNVFISLKDTNSLELLLTSDLKAEKCTITVDTIVSQLSDISTFGFRYNLNSLIQIFNKFNPQIMLICNNGLLKIECENFDIYLTPIKNQL